MGSLEAGKDGDFVLWSGDPLSTSTMALETWIEGKKYFDRAADLAAGRLEKERAELTARAKTRIEGEKDESKDGARSRGGHDESRRSVRLVLLVPSSALVAQTARRPRAGAAADFRSSAPRSTRSPVPTSRTALSSCAMERSLPSRPGNLQTPADRSSTRPAGTCIRPSSLR